MTKTSRPFRFSLRFKLALPVFFLVIVILGILTYSTFQTVRALVLDRAESRLQAIAEVFAETVKVPLILKNQQVLLANIEWMAKRSDVQEIRVEDAEGVIVGGPQPSYESLPSSIIGKDFLGVRRVSADIYAVAVPITAHDRRIGRVFIMFSHLGFEEELKKIFEDRLFMAFVMALILTLLTGGLTWFAIRPIFHLKQTVQEILAGDFTTRAPVYSYDEIQDLGEAFNEMVARLVKSFDSLRSRTEALEESEEKYRLIVENASDIIFTFTSDGKISLLNTGFSGYSREEIQQAGIEFFFGLHDEESRKKIQDAVVTANLLAGPLKAGRVQESDLAKVQSERMWPTKVIQQIQSFLQKRVIANIFRAQQAVRIPWYLPWLFRIPVLGNLPARVMAFGVKRVHVEE